MKRLVLFILLFAAIKVAGQTTGYLRFDTVKIMKQNGTCELYIINKTKDSLGQLTNIGGGLTRFIKPRVLNDSTFVVGLDTLVLRGATGGSGTNNTNIGSGYRLLVPSSQVIKTLFSDITGTWDSTSNANGLTYKVDTAVMATQFDLSQKLDSLHIYTAVDPDPDSIYAYKNGDSTFVGLIPKGGASDTTYTEKPIDVKTGTKDTLYLKYVAPMIIDGDSALTVREATTSLSGYLSARDKQRYDSAYTAFYNAFAGDTSILIMGIILRPSIDGSGNVTWTAIIDSDHITLNFLSTVTVNSSAITINYNPVLKVITMVCGLDEQLQKYGIMLGPSVGLNSASIQLSMVNNWGGYIHGSAGVYSSTGVYNNAAPTVTYTSSTGLIDLGVTGIETGGVQDQYKIGVADMKPGYHAVYDITGTTNTSLKFYLSDALGNTITGPPVSGAGFWWGGPTWWRAINPSSMGGSLSWMQNIFTSASNIWVIAITKKN